MQQNKNRSSDSSLQQHLVFLQLLQWEPNAAQVKLFFSLLTSHSFDLRLNVLLLVVVLMFANDSGGLEKTLLLYLYTILRLTLSIFLCKSGTELQQLKPLCFFANLLASLISLFGTVYLDHSLLPLEIISNWCGMNCYLGNRFDPLLVTVWVGGAKQVEPLRLWVEFKRVVVPEGDEIDMKGGPES